MSVILENNQSAVSIEGRIMNNTTKQKVLTDSSFIGECNLIRTL